ncbi:MAG: hypothetical protein LLG05_12555 [Porphyromonadaceae bacterium]|nr:hypothetical protein [Porphyromonadaceae bacterium]
MGNTFKTLSDGDIVRVMLESFHNKSTLLKTINRQHDKDFGQAGRKNAGSILIKNPNEYTVGSSAVISVQDITESTQTLTVATRRNVAVNISSYERTMSLDDFQAEIADPAMARLAAEVEYTVLADAYKDIYNLTGTPATTPASLAAVMAAGARLTQKLAPNDDRHLLFDPLAMAATVASTASYMHKASEVDRGFSKGYIGEAAGFKWWETPMVPRHTNGSRTDATPVVDISSISNGDTTLTTTGQTNAQTLKEGDVFTIADVYDVNQETKAPYAHLKQFVVTADKTCDTTDVYSIAPAIYTSGAKQNCYASAWTGSKAIVHVAAGGSGAASTAYTQNLAYHRDFLTVAFASLPMPHGDTGKQVVKDNVSMRMWQFSDGINDTHTTRFDVLFGWLVQRPEWAVRVRG